MTKVGTKVSHVLFSIMKSMEYISTMIKFIKKATQVVIDFHMHQAPSKDSLA